MARMDDNQLLAQLELLDRQAVGYYGGEIAGEQAKAMDYYLSRPFGTEEEGRSRAVSSDVWDVVEGLTPLILRPFVASDDVVRFNPVGPEDEDAAQQETDYINYVATQKNAVFNTLVAAVKTGLLQKVGVAKYWWEKSTRSEIERYYGISDDVYASLIADGFEVIEHTETASEVIGPDGMPMQEVTHDVTLRTKTEEGEAKYAILAPEEFRISRDASSPNPKEANYVNHVRKVTISAVREMGYDVEDDISDSGEDPYTSEQYLARRTGDEAALASDHGSDPSMREVTFHESYLRVDFDGDGIAELRKVCRIGSKILANEETEEIPFVAWTPYPQPHRFYGRCPADETTEIQLIKSALLRQNLDNIYTVNNNRNFVSNKVNLDDLLDNAIAGIVRVDGDVVQNHVMAAPITPLGAVIQPMIEYLDSAKENRTGFTRYNQGMDANSLNKTATGVRIIAEAGNMRVELIARAFAEQFLKPLMIGLHGLCRRHATKKDTVRLRGRWVEIDPRQWKTRYDMTVSVGLGTADKQMQLQGVQMLMGTQANLMQVGLVKPENLFNSASKLAELIGEKSPEKYFSDPAKAQPEPPPDPTQNPEFMLKMAEQERADKEMALREREIDLKEREAHLSALAESARLELETLKAIPSNDVLARLQAMEQQLAALNTQETAQTMQEPMQEPDQEVYGQA